MKRKAGTCKDCNRSVGRFNLSNKGLCYDCAKKRMVDYFDSFWRRYHTVVRI